MRRQLQRRPSGADMTGVSRTEAMVCNRKKRQSSNAGDTACCNGGCETGDSGDENRQALKENGVLSGREKDTTQ
jgi:hypothetical protein